MVRLGDGVRVLDAPRALTLLCADRLLHLEVSQRQAMAALAAGEGAAPPPALAAALGEFAADAPGDDETWSAELAELDRRFCGWVPGRWRDDTAGRELALQLAQRRRLFFWPRLSRPTLPSAVVRRAGLLAGARRIYIEDDLDGGAVVQAGGAEVTVYEPDGLRAAWLARQAELAGRNLAVVAEPPAHAEFDLALVYAGTPLETYASLQRGLTAVRPGGRVAVLVRPPSEWTLYEQLERAGLSIVAYHRELEPWLLPCGLVADAAADLVILERPAALALTPPEAGAAAELRAQPYLTIDFDNLDGERLTEENWRRFTDLIAHQAPRPAALTTHTVHNGRWVWCWYDEAGYGLTAELREDEDHLMVTLLPFDRELEYVVVNGVYTLFADRFTRTRPLRTRRWHEENVFG